MYTPKTYTVLKKVLIRYVPRVLSKITLRAVLLKFGIDAKWLWLVLLLLA